MLHWMVLHFGICDYIHILQYNGCYLRVPQAELHNCDWRRAYIYTGFRVSTPDCTLNMAHDESHDYNTYWNGRFSCEFQWHMRSMWESTCNYHPTVITWLIIAVSICNVGTRHYETMYLQLLRILASCTLYQRIAKCLIPISLCLHLFLFIIVIIYYLWHV